MSKNNLNITPVQTQNNSSEIGLRNVKITLKRGLHDFEERTRELLDDELFDVYEYLQMNLGEGFAEPTIRKWLNPTNNSFPDPEKLITLCKQISDKRTITALIMYLTAMSEGIKEKEQ